MIWAGFINYHQKLCRIYFLSWYIKGFFVFMVILLTGILEMVFLIMPQQVVLKNLTQLNAKYRQEYQIRYNESIENNQLEINQKNITQNLLRQLPYLNHHFTLSEIMGRMAQLATSSRITLVAIKPEKSIILNGWHKQSLNFNIQGEDKLFVRWLWLLGQQPWLWQVDECVIDKAAPGVNINLKLTIYYV